MGSPVKTDTKMLGSGKMRLCVLFALICIIVTMPRTQEEDTEDVQMLEEEDMRQLLNDLFISSRGARQLDINDEDSDLADVTDEADEADEASDDEVMEDSEAKMKAREDEVSRFNNYIDAIYRRMNAALRAMMMMIMIMVMMRRMMRVRLSSLRTSSSPEPANLSELARISRETGRRRAGTRRIRSPRRERRSRSEPRRRRGRPPRRRSRRRR